MRLRTHVAIKAVVVVLFGIGFVVIPQRVLSWYAVSLDPGGAFMTRLYGAAFLLLGVLLWSARKAPQSDVRRAIVLAVLIGDAIGFVVALSGQLSGLMNALGWTVVGLYLLLALGFAYYYFAKPAAASRRAGAGSTEQLM